MPKLIRFQKGGEPQISPSDWQVFRATEGEESAALLPGKVIVPFSWWTSHGTKDQYHQRALKGEISVWFGSDDDVLAHRDVILAGLKLWPILAVDFPIFRDGRGYSTAALLRDRFGWSGELRAIGDVLVDQILPLSRVGFDSFALRNDQSPEVAIRQLKSISDRLQDDWRANRSQVASSGIKKPALWSIPKNTITDLQIKARADELIARLQAIGKDHRDIRFATSLAAEDMVITDAIVASGVPIALFTLETGRLHQETIDMVTTVEQHYKIAIKRVYPKPTDIDAYVDRFGLNGFYDSEEAKKACCGARKVKPLNESLHGASAWISGQRKEQSVTRSDLAFEELDESRGIPKFNPLFDWSEDEVWAYLQSRRVPIHPLHLQGYPSIGCEPCTRVVKQGEDIRAGRWWWLQKDSKECGLHVN